MWDSLLIIIALASCAVACLFLFVWWLERRCQGADLSNGPTPSAPRANRSTTTKLSGLLIATCLSVNSGCSTTPAGPSGAIDSADASIQGADGHVATAATQTAAAQAEVRAAIPLSTPAATPHLKTADGQLTRALIELPLARADLKATQASLTTAKAESAALEADRDKWEAKYKGQWLAGKSWAVIWSLAIGLGLLLIAAAMLNFYTDIFVIPLKVFGGWIAHIFGGTIKAIRDLCAGMWTELASLFKKNTPVILPPQIYPDPKMYVPPLIQPPL